MSLKLVQDRSDTSDYPESYYQATRNRELETSALDKNRCNHENEST